MTVVSTSCDNVLELRSSVDPVFWRFCRMLQFFWIEYGLPVLGHLSFGDVEGLEEDQASRKL